MAPRMHASSGCFCKSKRRFAAFSGDKYVVIYITKSYFGGMEAGWLLELRIYSSALLWCFGVPVEEFYEAHLPAKSSQESQNSRFSRAHEHGWWTEDHRRPPPDRKSTTSELQSRQYLVCRLLLEN